MPQQVLVSQAGSLPAGAALPTIMTTSLTDPMFHVHVIFSGHHPKFQKCFLRHDGGPERLQALIFSQAPVSWRLPT